jgi:hypothetical protein
LKVLRKIIGLTPEEVKAGWRKLHNEELHDLCICTSPNIKIKLRKGWWGMWNIRGRRETGTGC